MGFYDVVFECIEILHLRFLKSQITKISSKISKECVVEF